MTRSWSFEMTFSLPNHHHNSMDDPRYNKYGKSLPMGCDDSVGMNVLLLIPVSGESYLCFVSTAADRRPAEVVLCGRAGNCLHHQ